MHMGMARVAAVSASRTSSVFKYQRCALEGVLGDRPCSLDMPQKTSPVAVGKIEDRRHMGARNDQHCDHGKAGFGRGGWKLLRHRKPAGLFVRPTKVAQGT